MVLSLVRRNIFDLPTNISLSYFWCSGFMVGVFLLFQVISGIVLSFLYVCGSFDSFGCVLSISNDSLFGWLIRYFHVWGVSFIFVLMFIHMGRALYYSSYIKVGTWNVGFILYLLMMVEAFLGYILPWHQMSYWAATVLTSIVEVIPFVGSYLFKYVVGGFSVSGVTLVRVFSLHVCLSFVILGLSLIHLWYLHSNGSNNPLLSGGGYSDVVFFHSFYSLKDGFVLCLLISIFLLLIWFFPNCVLDVESFIEANPMVTPVSIKPEWYFLFFYAMLRSVNSKLGGLVLVMVFLVVFWIPSLNVSCVYSLGRQMLFWSVCWFLGALCFLGGCHPEYPFVFLSFVFSVGVVLLFCFFKCCWFLYENSPRVKRLLMVKNDC